MAALDSHQEERLRGQWETLSVRAARANQVALEQRPRPGSWTAGEIFAHLGRYHEIFLERLCRIRLEENPRFARYSAEEDEDWPRWKSLSTDEVLKRLEELRGDLMVALTSLKPEEAAGTRVHPVLGKMRVGAWVEFFLLHEGHHLYTLLLLLRPVSALT